MKLRPVLTAGAIGTLVAAANAIPAHAANDEEHQDVVVLEAQVVTNSDVEDEIVESPSDEVESEDHVDEAIDPQTVSQDSTQDQPVVEDLTPPVVETEVPPVEEAEVEPVVDTSEPSDDFVEEDATVEVSDEPVEEDNAEAAVEPDGEGEAEPVLEDDIETVEGDDSQSDEEVGDQAFPEAEEEAVTAPSDEVDLDAGEAPGDDAQEEPDADAEAEATMATQNVTNVSAQNMTAAATQDVTIAAAEALAQALVGANIEITNVTYAGHEQAAGMFSGFESAIGIDSGVILSTGYADHQYAADGSIQYEAVLYGPNTNGATTGLMGTAGDDDLDELVEGNTSDAAVLEIEFIPTHDTVAFTYVFGSEEYPEFVGSVYNDVFAFFVNGENYATLDDGTIVSINNINEDENSEFFRDNPLDPDSNFNTGLNGMTTVLSFEAPVTPGVANLLKLAIADVGDSSYDSAVMIQAGSFTSPVTNTPPVADDQTVQTDIDTPVVIVLTGSDADGDELTFSIVNTDDLDGTLSVDGATVSFTPDTGFFGSTFFTYLVNDGQVDSDEATVTIFVDGEAVEIPEPTEPDVEPTEPDAEPTKSDIQAAKSDVEPVKDMHKETVKQPLAEHIADSRETVVPDDHPTVVESTDEETDHVAQGTLSTTGAMSAPLAIGGVLLVAAGAALLFWRRRASQ